MLVRWNTRMYSLIRKNQQRIISAIDPLKDVQKYDWLLQEVQIGQANSPMSGLIILFQKTERPFQL